VQGARTSPQDTSMNTIFGIANVMIFIITVVTLLHALFVVKIWTVIRYSALGKHTKIKGKFA